MGKNKNKKLLLVIIILLIILILLAGVTFAYFQTDIFKGNKELFFNYIAQITDEEKGFIDEQLINYFEKQKNMPYTDTGEISVNITDSNVEGNIENTNNMNLSFSGQVDSVNSKNEQNISLNYSDDVTFPLIYKQIEENIGIQTDYIGKKFVTVDSTESQNNALMNTQVVDSIKTLQENSEDINKEDIDHIVNTYLQVLNSQLKESMFSQVKEQNRKGYRLTLTGEDLKNIAIAILEQLKNDQQTLNFLNNEFLEKQNEINLSTLEGNDIDELIESINENYQTEEEQTIQITVYQSAKQVQKLEVNINNIINLKLEKNGNNQSQQYTISYETNENENMKIQLSANYTGLQEAQNVVENYEILFQLGDAEYKYMLNNNIVFTDSINVEEFNNENSLMLDDMDEEQRNTFLMAVVQRIQDVNKSQMEELNLEENENPLQYLIPSYILSGSNLLEDAQALNEEEITSFNSRFELYEGTNIKGPTVRGLISLVSENNGLENEEEENYEVNENYLIEEINFNGEEYEVNRQSVALIKDEIKLDGEYRIEFEKDEQNGRIYRVVINQK